MIVSSPEIGGLAGPPAWQETAAEAEARKSPDAPVELSERHRRMLAWVEQRRQRRRDLSDRTYLNRQRYNGTRGRHWMRYMPQDGTLVREAVPRYKIQWQAPHLLSRGETFVSLVGTTPMMFGAIPASNDPEDRESASATTKIVRAIANDEQIEMLRMDAARKGFVDGMAYVMAYWDAGMGRARLRVIDMESVFTDPACFSLQDSPVVYVETWEHIEQFRADFPDSPAWDSIDPRRTEFPHTVRRMMLSAEDTAPWGTTLPTNTDLDGIVCRRQFFIAPTQKRPRGQFVVMCNDRVIYDSDKKRAAPGGQKPGLPYIDAGVVYPLHPFRYKIVPGNYYGLSGVELLWDNVRIEERLVSMMLQGIAMTANPKMLVGRTTNTEGRFTDAPGEVWAYDAAAGEPAPQIVSWKGPDASAWTGINFIDAKTDDHIGINAASRGQMPARVDSGRAIKLLQNADLGVAQIAAMQLDAAFSGALWDCVRLERTFGSGERVRQLIGTTNTAEVIAFTNETMKGAANVWIKSSPFIGYSPAMMMEEAANLVKLGVFDLNDFRDAVMLPPSDAAQSSEYAVNKEQAAAENLLMERGEDVQVRPHEDSVVHLRQHRIFLQQKWNLLTPEARQRIAFHCDTTQAAIIAQQMGQAAISSPGQGPGGGGGMGPQSPMSQAMAPAMPPEQMGAEISEPQPESAAPPGDAGSLFNGGIA